MPNRFGLQVILLIIISRSLFINYNFAEWGDSYHYIKAGEYITKFSYPKEEKRLPLYPLVISLGSLTPNPIVFARYINFIIFVLSILLTYDISYRVFKSQTASFLTVLILAFNPLFFYWSLRIMAINLLALLVIVSVWIKVRLRSKYKYLVLGLLSGLAFLTRFDGLLLFFSFAFVLLYKRRFLDLVKLSSASLVTVSPWLLRNQIMFGSFYKSNYFSELSQFSYGLTDAMVWLATVLFLFCAPYIWSFLTKKVSIKLVDPVWITYFLLIIILNFLWPAAVPRLFVPVLPIISVSIVGLLLIVNLEKKEVKKGLFLILAFFVLRSLVRRPFLLFGKFGLLFVLFFNLISLFWASLNFKITKIFAVLVLLMAQFIVLYSVLKLHKNVGRTVLEASNYALSKKGLIAYSDETGVTQYYLNNDRGLRFNQSLSAKDQYNWVKENKVLYIVETSERNEGEALDFFNDIGYSNKVSVVFESKSNVGDTAIWSRVYKVIEN